MWDPNDGSKRICHWIWNERTVSILLCIGDEFQELEAPLQMVADALICQQEEIEQELQNRIPMKCVFKFKDTTISMIVKMEKEDWINMSAMDRILQESWDFEITPNYFFMFNQKNYESYVCFLTFNGVILFSSLI